MNVSKTYHRLLHAAKRIDTAGSVVHSAMLGLPQHIYSYRSQKTIDIGKETYRGFNKFVKTQMVVGEYADPTMKHDPVSEYVQRYHALHPEKEYDDDLLLEFDLLASIADKVNSVPDEIPEVDDDDENENEDTDSDDDPQFPIDPNRKNEDGFREIIKRNPTEPLVIGDMLRPIPGKELDASLWKGAVMLQHPMSVSEAYGRDAVPSLILGIDVAGKWTPDKTIDEMAEQRVYHGIMLNQPSILDVSYIMRSSMASNKKMKYSLKTSHGFPTVPRMFHECPVYIGGDSVETAEVITTSKFCKGIPVMNGQFFVNPDLTVAKRMIEAGHANMEEFRFFLGKMSWNTDLFRNVHRHRNMYSAFEVKKSVSTQDIKSLVDAIWNADGQRDSWKETLKFAPPEWNAWVKIFEMMNGPHHIGQNCGCAELKALKELHKKTVATQIAHWQQSNDVENIE